MTSHHDVRTLAAWLECDRHASHRVISNCHDLRDATYEILMSVDRRYNDVERWSKIIEAFQEMENNRAIQELGLEKLLEEAKSNKEPQEGR